MRIHVSYDKVRTLESGGALSELTKSHVTKFTMYLFRKS
jgi:hypothetical protein